MTDICYLDIRTTVGIQGGRVMQGAITERSWFTGSREKIPPSGRNDRSVSSRQRRDLGIHSLVRSLPLLEMAY